MQGHIYGASARSENRNHAHRRVFQYSRLATDEPGRCGCRMALHTCAAWAVAHLFVGLPLNLTILPRQRASGDRTIGANNPHVPTYRAMWLLGYAFAADWVVST